MAVSTNETIVALRGQMAEPAERALRELLIAYRADLKELLAKLDADSGVNGTDYTSTINASGD